LLRVKIGQALQPVFLGQHQPIRITVRLVVLIVVGQLELGKQLIDGIDLIRPARVICRASTGAALILPSFGL
jgi:hypothetical protein